MNNKMEYEIKNDMTVVYFFGEIDSHNVVSYRNKLNMILALNDNDVLFDFQQTSFIDSAGIGLVLGRYQQLVKEERNLSVCHLSTTAYKVFELSGLFEIIDYIKEVKV